MCSHVSLKCTLFMSFDAESAATREASYTGNGTKARTQTHRRGSLGVVALVCGYSTMLLHSMSMACKTNKDVDAFT